MRGVEGGGEGWGGEVDLKWRGVRGEEDVGGVDW